MYFNMNGSLYYIKEIEQKMMDRQDDNEDEVYFGQTHYLTQEVWIDKDLSIEKKIKTLIHELMHIYIKEYITTSDISLNEEIVCDLVSNSHDVIHEIVDKYSELLYERE